LRLIFKLELSLGPILRTQLASKKLNSAQLNSTLVQK
jgi:hypothetical protein